MTHVPAKVLTVGKQSSQYRVLVQIELDRFIGSFNSLRFGERKPFSAAGSTHQAQATCNDSCSKISLAPFKKTFNRKQFRTRRLRSSRNPHTEGRAKNSHFARDFRNAQVRSLDEFFKLSCERQFVQFFPNCVPCLASVLLIFASLHRLRLKHPSSIPQFKLRDMQGSAHSAPPSKIDVIQ